MSKIAHHSTRHGRKSHAAHKPYCSVCYRTRVMAHGSFTLLEYAFSTFFAHVTLTLIRYEPDPYSLEIYRMCENELSTFESYHSTACKCMHLVTRGHFCSRDKDGSLTIRSVIARNPMIHANLWLYLIQPELLAINILHCGSTDFGVSCSCDFDLDPMTYMYELDPYFLEM